MISIPSNLELLPFQLEAVEKMLTFLRGPLKGCYNACEMGLGKSVQTIAALNTLLCQNRVLVICPSVMRQTWSREFRKWSVFSPKILIIDTKEDFKGIPHAEAVIVSYDMAAKYVDKLDYTYDALVLDEAHYCLHESTSILTEKGYKPIKDVIVGDRS